MDRTDVEYQEEVLKQKSQNDGKESAIREKVRTAVLGEDWAKRAFMRIWQYQVAYLKEAVANFENGKSVHDLTQRVLDTISGEVRSKIVEGGEFLDGMRQKENLSRRRFPKGKVLN